MKNIWTEEDIKNQHGHIIIRNDASKPFKNLDFARTVVFKIGFTNSNVDKYRYGLCNILTDGWFCPIANTAKDFAEYLNADERGYRPITKEEFIQLINSSNQIFY